MGVLSYIPEGRENRISRIELNHLIGMGDFSIRRVIARESLTTPIINNGDGYYIPDFSNREDRAEAKKYSEAMKRRAYAELARARVIDGYLGSVEGGNIYKSARMLANLTQKQVAEATGMTVPEISKIENGRTMPTAEQHKAIEKVCGVKI